MSQNQALSTLCPSVLRVFAVVSSNRKPGDRSTATGEVVLPAMPRKGRISGLRSSFRNSSSASREALPSFTAAAKPAGSDSTVRPAAMSSAVSAPGMPARQSAQPGSGCYRSCSTLRTYGSNEQHR